MERPATRDIEPRLRFWAVVRRGIGYGVLGLVLAVAITLCLHGTHARQEFTAVTNGIAMIAAAVCALYAAVLWPYGDRPLRMRDARPFGHDGRAAAAAVMAPVFLRIAAACLVLFGGGVLLYELVDAASPGD
jgi:hypothetical protein